MEEKMAYQVVSLGNGEAEIQLQPGQLLMVTGPNGVGKSAFIEQIANPPAETGIKAERFFGSRDIRFEGSETDQVGQRVPDFLNQFPGSVTRYRHPWGQKHLKSVIRRILDKQAQTAQDAFEAVKRGESVNDAEVLHPQPINQINAAFAAARMDVRFSMEGGTLFAKQSGSTYTLDRLSDGELSALLLVGAIVVQPTGGFVLIDEPERHLNPAISGALIATAIRTRNDIGVILSTHDLSLIDWLRPDRIIHITGSEIVNPNFEGRRFSYSILGEGDSFPENLRSAILGSRRAVLLVEGTVNSEDRSLYAQVFPEWHIIPREGWDSVVSGVSALNQNANFHWLTAAGIVDGDGRDEAEIKVLANKNVFALQVPTIENVFLDRFIIAEMSGAIANLLGGATAEARISEITRKLKPVIEESKTELIARKVSWKVNRAISEMKVSIDDVRRGLSTIPSLDVDAIRQRVTAEFDEILSSGTVFDVIERSPIKNTKVPSVIAQTAGYESYKTFTKAVLTQIEAETDIGKRILERVREILPRLPDLAPRPLDE